MEYNRIVAVTGMPGLYEVLSSKTDGAIVRSLDDKSTKFVSSRIHNLSHLESIEIYTVRENVTLADVFNAMKESKEKLPDVKDNKALKSYYEKVYPDMDFERVYTSDMKKMVKWYEVLEANEVDFNAKPQETEEDEETAEEVNEEKATATATKKSKAKAKPEAEEEEAEPATATKKAAPKKAATKAKSKTAEADTDGEDKPKKTRKKKSEE